MNHKPKASVPAQLSYWLAPSFSDLWFISILFLLTGGTLAPKLLGDAGIGWHIRDGQQILQTHAIPRVDPFSATMSGHQWFAWEWLYDAVIAVIHDHAGLNGVVFFTALVIAMAYGAALRRALIAGATLPFTIFLLALSLGASSIHFLARPHVLSWLFCVIWFSILDGDPANETPALNRRLYWLPVIMLLWVNLHGGFMVGLILCAIYLIAALHGYRTSATIAERDKAGKSVRLLATATGLSFLASLVNPYGVSLYIHIYEYLGDRFLMDHIDEFQSPNFHGAGQKCFGLLLLITLVALAAHHEKIKPAHWLVILFATYSGLYASRNLPVSSLLLALIIAPLLSREAGEAVENRAISVGVRSVFRSFHNFALRVTTMEGSFRGHVWVVIAIFCGLWACLHNGELGSHVLLNARFSENRFPVEAVRFIERQNIREPMFTPDYWGGYLIYTLYPESKVFVDDRHDLYGAAFFRRYLATVRVEPGWNGLLDELRVNWVLVPRESPLANILKETPRWSGVYRDQASVLFHRTPG